MHTITQFTARLFVYLRNLCLRNLDLRNGYPRHLGLRNSVPPIFSKPAQRTALAKVQAGYTARHTTLHSTRRAFPEALHTAYARQIGVAPSPINKARPLQIRQLVDGNPALAGCARLRISGRMSDVCDALDQLAALEAAV
jgi:hypothetical protein